MQPIDIEDDGFVTVRLHGEGKDATVRLDLYEVHNRFVEMVRQYQGKPVKELHDAVANLLQQYQLPKCSHRAAAEVMSAVFQRVADLKNAVAGELMPSSPASMELPPSDSPAAQN